MAANKRIYEEVLKSVKPTKEEEKKTKKEIDVFLGKLKKNIKSARVIIGGSIAKNTWLKGKNEADIFIAYNYNKFKDKSNELSEMLEKAIKKSFKKYLRLHGSRDYFQIEEKDFVFEVVPILDIKKPEQAKNITDVSPMHVRFVAKHKKLCDDVRILKQFCKANNVYGAESYISGFSGYVCELLTAYYGRFENVVKNAAKWKSKVVINNKGISRFPVFNNHKVIIDMMKHHKDVMMDMNKSKLDSPLILVDPIQSERNAAAALNFEKFQMFVEACKKFSTKPSIESFIEKKLDMDQVRKKAGKNIIIILNAKTSIGKYDIIGCKLLKVFEHIKQKISENDFNLLDSGWEYDKREDSVFWFIVKKEKMSDFIERQGPPLAQKSNVSAFRKKHKNTFEKSTRIFAKIKRKYMNAQELVKDVINDDYVNERVKSISIVHKV